MRDPTDPSVGSVEIASPRTRDLQRESSGPNVLVDLAPPSGAATQRIAKDERRSPPARPPVRLRGGMWLVVVVYAICAAALAASIYARWFAD